LQLLVPADRDSPAVVQSPPDDVFAPPSESATPPPSRATSPPPARTASPSPTAAAAKVAVTVLNNSRIDKLAAKAARDFAARGWPIAATGNLSGRLPRTTVYYAPGEQAAAAALRKQFPAIVDVAPRTADLPGTSPLTVVVTRDYPH
jgi:hypothetical protein